MSWYCFSIRKCKSCNYEYQLEESTIEMANPSYGKCPKCGGLTYVINNNTKNDFLNKLKKKLES